MYPNYEIVREADGKVKTYLDTFGRPVLTFKAKNLEENHIKNIEVSWCYLILKFWKLVYNIKHKNIFQTECMVYVFHITGSLVSLHHE